MDKKWRVTIIVVTIVTGVAIWIVCLKGFFTVKEALVGVVIPIGLTIVGWIQGSSNKHTPSIQIGGDVSGSVHLGNVTNNYAIDIDKLEQKLNAKSQEEIDRLKEIIRNMEENRRNNPNPSQLYKEAYSLMQQGDVEGMLRTLDQQEDESDQQAADIHLLKAQGLELTKNFPEAERQYRRAMEIYPSLANTFALAYYLAFQNSHQEAERYYICCLELASDDDQRALTLNNLAILHAKKNQYKEAEKEFNEVLTIRRRLAAENPAAYEPNVAMTLNNLGNLHSDTNQPEKAEAEYGEALEIYRLLATENPTAYEGDVARTLNNLGVLHMNNGQPQKAEAEYGEALKIRRRLAKDNPAAYEPDVAMTLNNLAILHAKKNQHEMAEEEWNEALAIYRRLAKDNPAAYEPDVAMTLNNLGILHKNTNQYEKAEAEYSEALETFTRLAKLSPEAFQPDVELVQRNLNRLNQLKEQ